MSFSNVAFETPINPSSMADSQRKRQITPFLASVLLHLSFWLSLYWAQRLSPIQSTSQFSTQVEVNFIEAPKEKDDRPKRDRLQVVEQDQQLNDKEDPDARYLSRHSQRVQRQTRAAQHGAFKNSNPQRGQSASAKPKTVLLSDLRPQMQHSSTTTISRDESGPNNNRTSENRKSPPPSDFGNSKSPSEASSTDDHLKDVQMGMETMLSTREFVYYSYYQRIKERLRQHWEPSIRARMVAYLRQGRRIASTQDHITQVLITLNSSGELVKVEVLTPSGLELLDEAATDAFRAAQPFPNPPKGLIESDGHIRIRWDFILEAQVPKPEGLRRGRHAFSSPGERNDDNHSGRL